MKGKGTRKAIPPARAAVLAAALGLLCAGPAAAEGIVSEDLVPIQATAAMPSNPPAADSREVPWEDYGPAEEKPYWQAEAKALDGKPYWEVRTDEAERPYFLADGASASRPYWESEAAAPLGESASTEGESVPAGADAVPAGVEETRLASARLGGGGDVFSYYMFRDENGVAHLADSPDDPRYRLFTAEVKLARGLTSTLTALSRKLAPESLRGHIEAAAKLYSLDPDLIALVIKTESAWNPGAVSWAGAQGLMQLMPDTAKAVGCRNPFDPEDNILGGSRYLRQMLDRFNGQLDLALAAYNCGPERVAKAGRIPDISETKNYVRIIMSAYGQEQMRAF